MSEFDPAVQAEAIAACEIWKPPVRARMYLPELSLLAIAYAVAPVAWVASHDWGLTARSGSLMLFFAAIAEFVTLNRVNKKHILNDCRVKAKLRPWDISTVASIVGGLSLVAGLAGTVLWGFGDLLAGCR